MEISFLYETCYPEFKGGVEKWHLRLSKGLQDEGFTVKYLNLSNISEVRDGVTYIDIRRTKNSSKQFGARNTKATLSYAFLS